MIHASMQASTALFNAFIQGPDALGALTDTVVANRTALEDLNTAVSAFEGTVALEPGIGPDDLQRLHEAAIAFRAILSGGSLSPQISRPPLLDLQHYVLRIPQEQRDQAWDRVRRPLFARSFADLRPAILTTLGVGNIELTGDEAKRLDQRLRSDAQSAVADARLIALNRTVWQQFPGEHAFVLNGEVIAHDHDLGTATRKLVDYQREHGSTSTRHILPEGTPVPGLDYRGEHR